MARWAANLVRIFLLIAQFQPEVGVQGFHTDLEFFDSFDYSEKEVTVDDVVCDTLVRFRCRRKRTEMYA